VPLSLLVAVLIFVTSTAWVPRFGLVGAMWSYGLAMVVQLLGSALILAHACRPVSLQRLVPAPLALRRPLVRER
jgi:hypothetical protein